MSGQLVKSKRLALGFFALIATTPLLLGGLSVSAKTTPPASNTKPTTAPASNTKPTTAPASNTKPTTVLRIGSRGNRVSQVQMRLKQQGLYTGATDGIFETQTRAAVIAFQRAKGLRADGVVGGRTLAAMGLQQ